MTSKQSYSARMDLKKQRRAEAGLVSERFPQVASIVINMTYYQRSANPVLMLRTVNLVPGSPAFFDMDCMIKDCLNGGFDMSLIIKSMVKNRKKALKGKLTCRGKGLGLAPDHASIIYEVNIRYNRKS